jgi:hypothetical protein
VRILIANDQKRTGLTYDGNRLTEGLRHVGIRTTVLGSDGCFEGCIGPGMLDDNLF